MPWTVSAALAIPRRIASSELSSEVAVISITFATVVVATLAPMVSLFWVRLSRSSGAAMIVPAVPSRIGKRADSPAGNY
jgi:hypothetical protein